MWEYNAREFGEQARDVFMHHRRISLSCRLCVCVCMCVCVCVDGWMDGSQCGKPNQSTLVACRHWSSTLVQQDWSNFLTTICMIRVHICNVVCALHSVTCGRLIVFDGESLVKCHA